MSDGVTTGLAVTVTTVGLTERCFSVLSVPASMSAAESATASFNAAASCISSSLGTTTHDDGHRLPALGTHPAGRWSVVSGQFTALAAVSYINLTNYSTSNQNDGKTHLGQKE